MISGTSILFSFVQLGYTNKCYTNTRTITIFCFIPYISAIYCGKLANYDHYDVKTSNSLPGLILTIMSWGINKIQHILTAVMCSVIRGLYSYRIQK